MYRKILDENDALRTDVIFRVTDNAWIPCNEANRDYKSYLAWAAENNINDIAELQTKE